MTRYTPTELFNDKEPRFPCTLDLGRSGELLVEDVLRVLPGKRFVVKARHGNKVVLAKIFRLSHSYQKELRGQALLAEAKAPTPALLESGQLGEGGYCFYEFHHNLLILKDALDAADPAGKEKILRQLLALLQSLDASNICQEDLHLGNFAYAGDRLLVLDPASCRRIDGDADKKENLGLLLAQWPLESWPAVVAAIHEYFPGFTVKELESCGRQRWKKRLQDFLEKIYRECSYVRHWSVSVAAWQRLEIRAARQFCSPQMTQILESLHRPPASLEYLKKGESSQVYLQRMDERACVIKHSRNKTLGHLLRRCWRRSRGSNAWYFSHLLQEAGIRVPRPMALVERKLGPFVMESWFLSEYVEADTLLDVWLYEEPEGWQQEAVRNLFKTLRELRVSHGDMKATNLLVSGHHLLVIDYDGMRQHSSEWAAQKGWLRDRQRFLQNWPQRNLAAVLE